MIETDGPEALQLLRHLEVEVAAAMATLAHYEKRRERP